MLEKTKGISRFIIEVLITAIFCISSIIILSLLVLVLKTVLLKIF